VSVAVAVSGCLCGAAVGIPVAGVAFAIPAEGKPNLPPGWWRGRPAPLWAVLAIAAATAAAALVIARRLPAHPAIVGYLAIAGGGTGLAIIDLRVRRLPFALTGALYAIGSASLTANQLAHEQRPNESLLRAAAATIIVTAAFLCLALMFAGQLGLGDVVLVGVLAGMLAYLSWAAVVLGFAAGLLLQLPAALAILVRRQRRAFLPLGSSLVVGWLIAVATVA
jgi:leader peptidase (prepilin peptidase) / N-methyltransferase